MRATTTLHYSNWVHPRIINNLTLKFLKQKDEVDKLR